MPDPGTITRTVNALSAGKAPTSADPAVSLIYEQLRSITAVKLKREARDTMQLTDLVHDAVVKLFRPGQKPWESRAHFFGAAARAVEQLLVDRARRRRRLPRLLPEMDEIEGSVKGRAPWDAVAVSEVIGELERKDALLADIARRRIFAGQKREDISEHLGLPLRTLDRHWVFIRAWLYRRLAEGD